jgi:hypothetical protein
MKYAIVTFLVLTSAITTVAVAQDGTGHGPPRTLVIIVPQPTTPLPTTTLAKLFQPTSRLTPMTN